MGGPCWGGVDEAESIPDDTVAVDPIDVEAVTLAVIADQTMLDPNADDGAIDGQPTEPAGQRSDS